jgi:hypothetical protein
MSFITLKKQIEGPVEVKNGSIYVAGQPGQIVEVDEKQLRVALESGFFEETSGKPRKKTDQAGEVEN